MIKKAEEMYSEIKKNMRGGDGQVVMTKMVDEGDYKGKSRLMATLTLEPGCSIGEHMHENEEEIFYIIEGEAQYLDNGEWITMKKGDSCICLGGQSHSIANRSDKTLVVAAIILTY